MTTGRFRLWAAAFTLAALNGCGGGGDSAPPPQPGPPPPPPAALTLSGTAATGAPLAGGTLRVIDRAGVTRTLAAPIGADGRYTIEVTGLSAPLLVVAEGRVGESTGQMMALAATAPASGTITVNATPLTTAIAALVAGGDPATLAQPATLAAVTGSAVTQAVNAVNTALAPQHAAAGVGAGFNPMSTQFAVGQPGQDRLLDAVKVEINTAGVTFTNATAPLGADGAPQAGTVITVNAANLASPPAIAAGTGAVAVDFLHALRTGFNACFARPAAARATASECTGLFAPGYQMNGYSAEQRWIGNFASLDNAAFSVPELLYTAVDPTDSAPLPVLRFVWVRSDGEFGTRVEVLRNYGSASAPAWLLRGNLRPMEFYVEPRLARLFERNPAVGVDRYELGLRVVVNLLGPRGNEIGRVRLRGPGLPAGGLMLVRGTSCGTASGLVIQNDAGTIANWTTNASNNYRLAFANVDPARPYTWPGASRNFRDTPLTAAELAAIRPGAVYQWEVWTRDPTTKAIASAPVVYYSSLSSPLPSPDGGAGMRWHTLTDATLAELLSAGSAATTGATINYLRAAGAEPVRSLYLFGSKPDPMFNPPALTDTTNPLYGALLRMGAASPVLAPSATSTAVSVAAEGRGVDFDIGFALPACGSVPFPATAEAGAYREIGLDSILPNGVRKRTVYAWSN